MPVDIPIDQMTVLERIAAMEALWRSLTVVPSDIPAPSWHGDILAAREDAIQSKKAIFVDWEESKQALRKRFS